jgi:hypothetical protein
MTIREIAEHFKISEKSARNKICKAGLKRDRMHKGKALYRTNNLHLLATDNNKYYPLKTTIIYHIYESKMNFNDRILEH